MIRAAIRLDAPSHETAHHIRQTVDAWTATRPGMTTPTVQHITTPSPGDDGLNVHTQDTWERFVLVMLQAPTPDDLLTLADALRAYGQPRLTLTRDAVGGLRA